VKFRPLNDRILIKPVEETYRGLIVIPRSVKKDAPMMAEVLAVGPGMLMKNGDRWPMPCVPGDMILFPQEAGQPVVIDGGKFRVIRDDHVLALLVQD
jgi:chaperonin GroES